MNNKFDWNRFCKVVNKDFRNIWPLFGTSMLILAALPFAVWLFMAVLGGSNVSLPPDIRLLMIQGVAMIAAIMTPSRMYRTWNLHNEGTYYAMLPASKMEKFTSAALFSIIICPLAVYLGSMLLDIVLTILPFGPYNQWIWQCEMGFPFTFDMSFFGQLAAAEEGAEIFSHFGSLWVISCWLGYIGSVLMFMFTSTIFKKHKVLQTILWIYLIEFALSIILMPVMIAGFGNADFMDWFMQLPERYSEQQFTNWLFGLSIGINVLIIALFGWLSWRRLKKMAY